MVTSLLLGLQSNGIPRKWQLINKRGGYIYIQLIAISELPAVLSHGQHLSVNRSLQGRPLLGLQGQLVQWQAINKCTSGKPLLLVPL
jgi:hypothetical protein